MVSCTVEMRHGHHRSLACFGGWIRRFHTARSALAMAEVEERDQEVRREGYMAASGQQGQSRSLINLKSNVWRGRCSNGRKDGRKEGRRERVRRERDMPETTPPPARSRDGYNYQHCNKLYLILQQQLNSHLLAVQVLAHLLLMMMIDCLALEGWTHCTWIPFLDSCGDPRLPASRSN